jgi:uncharacterized protein YgiB involved in biofilm formation
MLTRTRRRSSRITLVLIGTAALVACSDSTPQHRDVYASKQDCVQDWGDENKCDAAPASAGTGTGRSHTGGGYFWGPIYSGLSHRNGTSAITSSSIGSGSGSRASGNGSRAIGSSSISRGGFGSSASSHSSGG